MTEKHETVLLEEAVNLLSIRPTDTVVDATIGGAGHFAAIQSKLGTGGTLIGIDADPAAIGRAKAVPTKQGVTVHLVNDNFKNLDGILDQLDIPEVDKVLFDLGWSSFHLDSGKGFSFNSSEPLLMTYGEPEAGQSAAELINTSPEETLADIIFTYGEESFSRQIAKAIVQARRTAPILMTDQLVDAVLAGTPSWYHHRRLHPATKVFQALRIAVNDELGVLRTGLTSAIERLPCGGRIAVISFHSIEDRIVKTLFRDAAHAGLGMLAVKKPVIPTMRESMRNPRARSAKLRVYEQCVTSQMSDEPTLTPYAYA